MKPSKWLAQRHRKLLISLLAGGSLMQFSFSGCDQQLRDTLLTGVEASIVGLVTTFINAFFEALMSQTSATSQPIVQALSHFLPSLA